MATTDTDHTSEAEVEAEAEALHGNHPQDATYWKIFVFLFAVTLLEVLLYYKSIPGVNVNNAALGVLAVVKFATVVGYFMHLKFDSRILRRLFITGLVLAVAVYCTYMLTLGVFLHPASAGR